MLLRRRFMVKKLEESKSVAFSFIANFQNNQDKNITQASNNNVTITKEYYGIAFCVFFKGSATTGVERYASLGDTVSISLKITDPNNNVYEYNSDDILASDGEGKGLALRIKLDCDINGTTDLSSLYQNNGDTYGKYELTYLGTNNIIAGTAGTELGLPKTNILGAVDYYSTRINGSFNLANGDYTFEITLDGNLPEGDINVSNYVYTASTTVDKNTYYCTIANRSKKTWVIGDSQIVDSMYKMDGTI